METTKSQAAGEEQLCTPKHDAFTEANPYSSCAQLHLTFLLGHQQPWPRGAMLGQGSKGHKLRSTHLQHISCNFRTHPAKVSTDTLPAFAHPFSHSVTHPQGACPGGCLSQVLRAQTKRHNLYLQRHYQLVENSGNHPHNPTAGWLIMRRENRLNSWLYGIGRSTQPLYASRFLPRDDLLRAPAGRIVRKTVRTICTVLWAVFGAYKCLLKEIDEKLLWIEQRIQK